MICLVSTASRAACRGRLRHHAPAAAGLQLPGGRRSAGGPEVDPSDPVQGIVGGMPWIAMGYITMFLQLLGFSDWLAGALTALFWGGTVAGNLLGGLAGDLLVRRLPHAGVLPYQGFGVQCQREPAEAEAEATCSWHRLLRAGRPFHDFGTGTPVAWGFDKTPCCTWRSAGRAGGRPARAAPSGRPSTICEAGDVLGGLASNVFVRRLSYVCMPSCIM